MVNHRHYIMSQEPKNQQLLNTLHKVRDKSTAMDFCLFCQNMFGFNVCYTVLPDNQVQRNGSSAVASVIWALASCYSSGYISIILLTNDRSSYKHI